MDTSKVYDVSEKQRKIAEWRDAKRKELRALYLKDSGHPTKTLLVRKLVES
jgi:type II secretory pathway component PulL